MNINIEKIINYILISMYIFFRAVIGVVVMVNVKSFTNSFFMLGLIFGSLVIFVFYPLMRILLKLKTEAFVS